MRAPRDRALAANHRPRGLARRPARPPLVGLLRRVHQARDHATRTQCLHSTIVSLPRVPTLTPLWHCAHYRRLESGLFTGRAGRIAIVNAPSVLRVVMRTALAVGNIPKYVSEQLAIFGSDEEEAFRAWARAHAGGDRWLPRQYGGEGEALRASWPERGGVGRK